MLTLAVYLPSLTHRATANATLPHGPVVLVELTLLTVTASIPTIFKTEQHVTNQR